MLLINGLMIPAVALVAVAATSLAAPAELAEESCRGTGPRKCYECIGQNCTSGCCRGESCAKALVDTVATYSCSPSYADDHCGSAYSYLYFDIQACVCNTDFCNAASCTHAGVAIRLAAIFVGLITAARTIL